MSASGRAAAGMRGVIVRVPPSAYPLDAYPCRRRHDLVPLVDAGRVRHTSHPQNNLDWLRSHIWTTHGEILSIQGESETHYFPSLLLKGISGPGNGHSGS